MSKWSAYCQNSQLIVCSVWYGFYCRPDLLKIYATAAFAVGVAGVILPWSAWFNQRKNKVNHQ